MFSKATQISREVERLTTSTMASSIREDNIRLRGRLSFFFQATYLGFGVLEFLGVKRGGISMVPST